MAKIEKIGNIQIVDFLLLSDIAKVQKKMIFQSVLKVY